MTRHDDDQIGTYGGYGSGVGTYVIYLALAAVITIVLRWVC
jgi:hypothetical protein